MLTRLGFSTRRTTCDHCGRRGLQVAVVFQVQGTDRMVYVGRTCAEKFIAETLRRGRVVLHGAKIPAEGQKCLF